MCPAAHSNARIARAEPGDHLAQLFASSAAAVDAIVSFARQGIERGDGVVLLLMEERLNRVRNRLKKAGLQVSQLEGENRLVLEDADQVLSQVTVNQVPDSGCFDRVIGGVIDRLRGDDPDRQVRLYGELVQLLRSRANEVATIQLERLWDELVQSRGVFLLCGYNCPGPDEEGFPVELRVVHNRVFRDISSRDRLMLAARKLFAEGYESTTTAKIAEQAGSSQSQIIKHFGSKEGLLETLCETWWEDVLSGIDTTDVGQVTPAEKLSSIMDHLVLTLRSDEMLTRVVLFEGGRLRNGGPTISPAYFQFAGIIEQVLKQAAGANQLAAGWTPQIARDTLIGGCAGLFRFYLMGKISDYSTGYDFDQIRTAYAALVRSFFSGAEIGEGTAEA